MISFVLVTRNDNYEGNPIERLKTSLTHNLNTVKKVFTNYEDFEWLIGDWGSENPITKEMLGVENHKNVKIVYFNKDITSKFDTPFNEVHPLNYLIKNSSNEFVARLDQDIMIGEDFFIYVKETTLNKNKLYWSTRRDLFKDFIGDLNDNKLNFNPNNPTFYKSAIGVILASKNNWCDIKGYNENNIQRNHMEHDLYLRFIEKVSNDNLINLGVLLDSPFYHIFHERNDSVMRQNNNYNLPFINDENWGLEIYKNKINE